MGIFSLWEEDQLTKYNRSLERESDRELFVEEMVEEIAADEEFQEVIFDSEVLACEDWNIIFRNIRSGAWETPELAQKIETALEREAERRAE